jgi:SlyX protein
LRQTCDLAGMNEETSHRLERLEASLAHLEHLVEQLNEVVTGQGKLLERLKKEVRRQSSAIETIELERIKATNPRPPHH